MSNKKPFIANDTRQPLVVLGAYPIDERGGIIREPLKPLADGVDTGADPLGDGTFRMYPSGDIVSYEERNNRLRVVS